jgi:thiol-disulfide isomerase/thioredoxin
MFMRRFRPELASRAVTGGRRALGGRTGTGVHSRLTLAAALLLGAAGAAADAAPARAQDVGIDVGKVPPAVTIEDLDGNPVELAQYVGKRPVLLEFWAEWCEVCEALEPRLEAAATRHAGKADVLVIAVAVNQTRRSIRRHLEQHQPPGRLLWDTSGRATRAYQAPSTSYVVVLDAKGRVSYTGVGAAQDLSGALDRALAAR